MMKEKMKENTHKVIEKYTQAGHIPLLGYIHILRVLDQKYWHLILKPSPLAEM